MKTLSLSPSTQEHNIAVDGHIEEYTMNKFADDLTPYLRGVQVVRNDRTLDAKYAVRLANRRKVNLHFSLHTNAGGGNGVEAFYDPSKPRSMELAQRIVSKSSAIMGIPNRGIKDGVKANLIEVNGIRRGTDAILVEWCFHDNKKDDAEFHEHYKQLVNEVAYELKRYFGVK
jgi:N-acetylmuramoyl-L-alanine amidase